MKLQLRKRCPQILLATVLTVLATQALAQGERSDWHTLELTDARTGEVFTLAGFGDRTVFVEAMATWCVRCARQLDNMAVARPDLSEEEVVFVAISVEGNLPPERLAAYAESRGFDWIFAVATPELLTALVETFGRTITNPPSTPHFLIYADGTFTELATGIKQPEEIVALVQGL